MIEILIVVVFNVGQLYLLHNMMIAIRMS